METNNETKTQKGKEIDDREDVEQNDSTINYTSGDNKISVKITAGHICSAIIAFIMGIALGITGMSKYTIIKKEPKQS